MTMKSGIKKTTGINNNDFLFAGTEGAYLGCSIIVGANGVTAGADGRKIVKAGTPLYGDLENRATAMTIAGAEGAEAVGLLRHDVDVTNGDVNDALMYHGSVNLDRLDTATRALITTDVKASLKGGIYFFTDN